MGMLGLPQEPGSCLQAVRVIVEAALHLNSHEMYDRWLVAGTTRRHGNEKQRLVEAKNRPWAADFEASVKKLNWGIPLIEREAGDLIFDHQAAVPFGHVGVLIDRDTVLENIDPGFRPASVHLSHSSLSLTPLWLKRWTLVARIPKDA